MSDIPKELKEEDRKTVKKSIIRANWALLIIIVILVVAIVVLLIMALK
jgi:cell division septal protein FtsQ